MAELLDHDLERGRSLPTYQTLTRLAEKLGVPLQELTESLEGEARQDAERVVLEVTLANLARNLEIRDLRVAVEQVQGNHPVKHAPAGAFTGLVWLGSFLCL